MHGITWRAYARAIARPMPPVDPVTTTKRPATPKSIVTTKKSGTGEDSGRVGECEQSGDFAKPAAEAAKSFMG